MLFQKYKKKDEFSTRKNCLVVLLFEKKRKNNWGNLINIWKPCS